jgi:hypothetical protein
MSSDLSGTNRRIESVLSVDIGSTLTHACLVDLVEGVYRFVAQAEAPTTLEAPEDDVTIGARRAIRRIEHVSRRVLLNRDDDIISPERDSGEGVDAFVACSNAALPIRCVLIGLTDDLSIDSARRACQATQTSITHTVALGQRAHRWDDAVLTHLRKSPPDVIVMVGGVDMGPIEPLISAARVLVTVYEDVDPERRPAIIFAANQEARRPVVDVVSALFDIRVVENVRPSLHAETPGQLSEELSAFYSQIKLATLSGYRRLRDWCTTPIVSTTEALGATLRYLARRNELPQGVLAVDVGGNSTYVGAARQDDYRWVTGTSVGTGQGVEGVMRASAVEDIERWLPITLTRPELVYRLENARLRPHGIPQSMEDLLLTQAVTRQSILSVMRLMKRQNWQPLDTLNGTTPPFDLIAARGGAISHTPQDGLVMMALLDAVQPTGLARIVLDWASIWPQLGAMAPLVPMASAQVLDRDSFRELGTVIAPIGEAREGAFALNIRLIRGDASVTEMDVPAGVVRRVPLSLQERATVEVRPGHAFDIGLGRKGAGGKAVIHGGTLGIVIDTRGRPLSLPRDPKQCRARMQEWIAGLTGVETIESGA